MRIIQQDRAASTRPTLNPFVFPADTNVRFVLLVVALIATSLFAFNWMHNLLTADEQATVARCQIAAAQRYPVDLTLADSNPELYLKQLTAQATAGELCIAPFNRVALLWMLGGTLALFATASAIYLAQPAWHIRSNGLKPLSAEKYQPLRAHLHKLQEQAGVHQQITFLANPSIRDGGGLAFGHLRRLYICLYGGLIVKFMRDRDEFDAIMLHELAHHRNRDVNITAFAVAVWRAFVVVVLLPFAVTLVFGLLQLQAPSLVLDIAWRIVPLAALVYIYRTAVLRSREYYADTRASVWIGSPDTLAKAVGSGDDPTASWWARLHLPSKITQKGKQLFARHPAPGDRQRVLDNPNDLFQLALGDALGVGVVAGVAMPQLTFAAQLLIPTLLEYLAFPLAALFVGPLIAAALGVGVWRAVFAQALAGQERIRPLLLAGTLTLGLALGVFISFDTAIPLAAPGVAVPSPFDRGIDALFFTAWMAVVFVVLYIFVCWMVCTAEMWLPTVQKRRSLGRMVGGTAVVMGIFLSFWLALLFIGYSLGQPGVAMIISALRAGYIGNATRFAAPLIVASAAALCGLPLLRAGAYRAVHQQLRWPYLDDEAHPMPAWGPHVGPRFALLAGLLGGFIGIALLVFLSVGKTLVLPQTLQDNEQFLLLYWYGRLTLAAIISAALAAIVAFTQTNSWPHSLLAALICSCLLTIGLLGISIVLGGSISIGFTWSIFAQVATWGMLLAVPAALLCSRAKAAYSVP